jgi:hypothetical protein
MIEIWNTFCEDISKNKSVTEMVFEKDIVKSFLQELGWSRYKHNLKEQLGLYKGKWRPDFVFYLNNDEENKEIILELKKPDHKQRKADIEQIEAYMKLTDCRFGLYFGEKLEVFYLMDVQGKRSAVSVTNIDWTPGNLAGTSFIKLLAFQTYDTQKLEKYCLENIEANDKIEFWKTEAGQDELYNAVINSCNLSEAMVNNLRHILKFQIQNITEAETPSPTPVESNTQTQVINEDIISEFKAFAENSVGINTTRNYIRHLKGNVSKFFAKIIDKNTESIFTISDSLELKDCIATLKANNEFIEANKKDRYYYTASLSKYLEFLESKEGITEQTSSRSENQMPGEGILFNQEMKQAGGKCQMTYYPESKRYVVKKGSNLLDISYDSCGSGARDLREKVKKDSALCRKEGDLYTLLEDIIMPDNLSSPTGASKFCWGTSRPGPKDWQDEDGKTYPSEWWK